MSDIASPVFGMGALVVRHCTGDEGIVHNARMPDMLPVSLPALEDLSTGSVWCHRSSRSQSIGWPVRKALPLRVGAWPW